jgi:hypothetical protein
MIYQIYQTSLEFSKLKPNSFQTIFEMTLQKDREGPKRGPHNQRLKNAIKHLKAIGKIKFENKDISDKTEYDKSTVSEYIRGIEPASEAFEKEFEKKFGVSLEDFDTFDETNPRLSTKGVNITLQDYIDLLHRENDRLFTLLNSTLGRIHDDSRASLAYQKAWVKYEAERSSGGDKQKEDQIKYKMSKLVDDELKNETLSGNHDEIDS